MISNQITNCYEHFKMFLQQIGRNLQKHKIESIPNATILYV